MLVSGHVTHRFARARATVLPRACAHVLTQAPSGPTPPPGSMLVSGHTPHRSARARALITAPRLRPSSRHSRTAPRSYPRSSQVSFRTHVPPMSHALRFWPAPALSFCPAPAPLVERRRRPRAARPTLRLACRGIPPCSLRRCASYKESFEVRISRPAHPMHTPGRHTKQRCTLRRRSAAADGPVMRPRERPVRDLRNVGGVGSRQLYAEYLRCLGSLRCQQHLYTARFTC